jgi:ABC-2 type transport system ATP-binding protein
MDAHGFPPRSEGERSASAAIRCAGLVKRYEDVVAVNGIALEILRGECFGLLGPNGAGKTTTVEILEGLNAPDGGSVEILGWRWGAGRDRELRERLGVQLQETQLAEKLTVEETLRLFASFFSRPRAVAEVIGMVELGEKRRARVGRLSGGQRQRLALACALVSDPDVLFLDEPTTGLDPQARLKVWDIVATFGARGGTVLLTTHSMEEAARLCDRVAIMDHGTILALDAPAALVASLDAEQIVEFEVAGGLLPDPLASLPGVGHVSSADGVVRLSVRRIGEAMPALLAELERQGVELKSLATHQATLEDVFVHLTGRALRDE